ncbi:MAG: hypothetical protein JSV90_08130 [Methanobacteriota archaeon]|nr:MAG: hypothetical protein JSV90_08130 [Euryarchaeota archaeon]
MVKNLFTKHDHKPVNGITKEQAVQASAWYWRSRQFGVSFLSPYYLQGAQFQSKLGLRQSVDVRVNDEGDNVGVDVTFSAELTDEGAVLGAVGAVLVLPAAALVGAVSYMEYENDAERLMKEYWAHLYGLPKSPPPAVQPSPGGGSDVRSCPGCGAPQDKDAKFCKHCGNAL